MTARDDILAALPAARPSMVSTVAAEEPCDDPSALVRTFSSRFEQAGGRVVEFVGASAAREWLVQAEPDLVYDDGDALWHFASGAPAAIADARSLSAPTLVRSVGGAAATGTVVLSDVLMARGIQTAMLPSKVYVAVAVEHLRASVAPVLERALKMNPSSIHLVSGTSCTGDLGLLFLRDAHGPKEVCVLLITRVNAGTETVDFATSDLVL